jgi:hypothetical protein
MILNYREQVDSFDFEIVDLETGQSLPMETPYDDVWYADDEKGIIRYYIRNDKNDFMFAKIDSPSDPIWHANEIAKFDPDGNPVGDDEICVAWKEERRSIKIVRKSEVLA